MNVSAVIFEFDWDLGSFQIGQCASATKTVEIPKIMSMIQNLPKRYEEAPLTKKLMQPGAVRHPVAVRVPIN